MKKTLQSIRVNDVDQEVTIMNTLTSDQATESDIQTEFILATANHE